MLHATIAAFLMVMASDPAQTEAQVVTPRLAALGHSCEVQRGISAAAFRRFLHAPSRKQAGWTVVVMGASAEARLTQAKRIAEAASAKIERLTLDELMSKTIGETEKNLDRLFERAAREDWVLFFDEADALFGKRTEVKDAHDRYANQEIAYLLERVRANPDLVIVGTSGTSVARDGSAWFDAVVAANPKDRETPLPWHRLCWPPRSGN
jgi:hypothetical protein